MAERVWRVRKDSRSREARLSEGGPGAGVELQRYHDGALVAAERFETRAQALAEAAADLQRLQIEGWATHW